MQVIIYTEIRAYCLVCTDDSEFLFRHNLACRLPSYPHTKTAIIIGCIWSFPSGFQNYGVTESEFPPNYSLRQSFTATNKSVSSTSLRLDQLEEQ